MAEASHAKPPSYAKDAAVLASMGVDDALVRRAAAPLGAIALYQQARLAEPGRSSIVAEALHADLFGKTRTIVAGSKSTEEGVSEQLVRSILQLIGSVVRLQTFPRMFRVYPWRGAISRANHFLSSYYLLCHECYILEERLKIFVSSAEAYAKMRGIDWDSKSVARRILRDHKILFGHFLKVRGSHVHVGDVEPKELDRLSLIETLIELGEEPAYRLMYSGAIRDARRECVRASLTAVAGGYKLLAALFHVTRRVWEDVGRTAHPDSPASP
ncbi:MAG: hypothetical protein KDK07_25575 [Bauldia sp.]|nr:hypothetical protein [Bauldia sp.]